MPLKVAKAPKNRMFLHVVEQLENAMLEGELAPGDMLPPEHTLKEMFATGRGTIREALRVLEAKGLIETRVGVGGGAVVTAPRHDKVAESLDLLIQFQQVGLDHLAEFRTGVEGLVAELAAERVTKEGAARLRALNKEAGAALQAEGVEAFLRKDIAVHVAIAEIAQNPVYLAVLKMVHEQILGAFESFTFAEAVTYEENRRDLGALVEAVSTGEVEKAGALAREHVRKYNKHMKKKQEQQKQ